MKKILACVLLSFLILTGCNSIIHFSTSFVDINSCDSNVLKWVESNKSNNGIYLGRVTNSGVFYVYVNNKKPINGVYKTNDITTVDSTEDGINISVKLKVSDAANQILFKINTGNQNIKYLNLNGSQIKLGSISQIE